MYQVISIKSKDLFPLISEIIKQDEKVRITVTGTSMLPFLREGIDSVELTEAGFSGINRGDIVIIRRSSGEYIMHRVIKKEASCFYIMGDAQQWLEGPLYPEQLVAVITALWRRGRRIEADNFFWRALSKLWIVLIPFRQIIIGVYGRLHHMHRCFE
jgi:hypothetical protein